MLVQLVLIGSTAFVCESTKIQCLPMTLATNTQPMFYCHIGLNFNSRIACFKNKLGTGYDWPWDLL